MLIQKFNYNDLSKVQVNGKRHYILPDGSKVPSVTTILDKTKSEEKKEALTNWKKRVGKVNAQSIATEAAGRGTRMHSFLEGYLKEDKLKDPGKNPYSVQSYNMAQKIIKEGLIHLNEAWGLEAPLYYPELYAGTTDCVGVWKGHPAIIDFKQTNRPKRTEWIDDYFIQLAAYKEAHNEMFNTNIQVGVILMCSKDGHFQHWVVSGSDMEKYTHQWWDKVEAFFNI